MKKLIAISSILFTVSISSLCISATYYVNGTVGDDSYDGLAQEWDGIHGPVKTIQMGIVVASHNDQVIVAGGTYTGLWNKNIDFLGKAVTLESESGPSKTTIDCEGVGRGFNFHFGEDNDSVVEGFTIMNGRTEDEYGPGGGGILCANGSAPTITQCVIKNNDGAHSGGGGGISFSSDVLGSAIGMIYDCVITDNVAVEGGGLYSSNTDLMISDCTISRNISINEGGGARIEGESSVVITDTEFCDNVGSGLVLASTGNHVVSNCLFQGNQGIVGGGIRSAPMSNTTVLHCEIVGNSARDGGGVYSQSASPWINNDIYRDCVIAENWAWSEGGGMYISEEPVLENCRIENNWAEEYGGGLYVFQRGDTQPHANVKNCTVIGNWCSGYGGGIYFTEHCISTWSNFTITDNWASIDGGAAYCENTENEGPVIINSILWENMPNAIGVTGDEARISYSDIQGGYPGTGNIDADPLFVSSPFSDYALSQIASGQASDSPCIDAGSDTAASLGYDNMTTRTDGGDDAGVVDMGFHVTYKPLIYSIEEEAGDIVICWHAKPGASFFVQWSTDMELWNDVFVGVTYTWTDTNAIEPEKYYRVFEY